MVVVCCSLLAGGVGRLQEIVTVLASGVTVVWYCRPGVVTSHAIMGTREGSRDTQSSTCPAQLFTLQKDLPDECG